MNKYTLIFIILIFGCDSHQPFIGKWDIEDVSYKTNNGLCERIVMTKNMMVCDGKRFEVQFKELNGVWEVTSKTSVDSHWTFRIINSNKIATKISTGHSVIYNRVLD